MMTEEVRRWICSFYKDPEGLEEITEVDLGEVWAGQEGRVEVWVRNDDYGLARGLTYTTTREDVRVTGPGSLKQREMGLMIIRWSPGGEIKFGLGGSEFIIRGIAAVI